MTARRKFLVEREIPAIGYASPEELKAVAQLDQRVINEMDGEIQWLESFVGVHKTFCVYLATDEAVVRRHSERAGFPADRIVEVTAVIDPSSPRPRSSQIRPT